MAVPILKQGHYLIASVQSAITDQEVVQLQEDLADQVGRYRARGIIVDVTGLDVVDSFVSRSLRNMAFMTKMLGAEAVIVGIQPEVAYAMVQLGLALEGVHTALDLEEGLAFLRGL
ncbi:MAG: STAS domain-containing protein [Acidimicrobiia bacterium]